MMSRKASPDPFSLAARLAFALLLLQACFPNPDRSLLHEDSAMLPTRDSVTAGADGTSSVDFVADTPAEDGVPDSRDLVSDQEDSEDSCRADEECAGGYCIGDFGSERSCLDHCIRIWEDRTYSCFHDGQCCDEGRCNVDMAGIGVCRW